MVSFRPCTWCVTVFASNEAATLKRCLASIEVNAQGKRTQVTLILNGTRDASLQVLRENHWPGLNLSVIEIPAADKANALNHVIHGMRPEADVFFFMDAYTKLLPGAMRHLAQRLEDDPYAHMTTGIPINGRSAKFMQAYTMRGGSVNGQFYAMRPAFLNRLRDGNIRIPLGMYRNDPLISSMANNDLDGIRHPWDVRRVQGVIEAHFEISPLSVFRWEDLVRQFRREVRQSRGDMENGAIKALIRNKGYAGLPHHSDDLIRDWLRTNPVVPGNWRGRLLRPIALRQLRASRPHTPEALEPRLVLEIAASDLA